MEKIENWDNVQAMNMGERETLEAQGYVCKILKAEERLSKSNKKMLCILFDIVEGPHAGYYNRLYENQMKTNKDPNKQINWQGVYRQMLEGDNFENYLKGLTEILEKNNPGYKFDFDQEKMKGLIFGGLFGKEEYIGQFDGKVHTTTRIRYIIDVDKVKNNEYNIPPLREVEKKENPFSSNENPFGNTVDDDDLPF